MSTAFLRNPQLLLLAVGVIVALATSAAVEIPRQEDPTITNLFATIVTPYPGAEPARVEALVTEKIEEELAEIAEIDVIASVSRTGVSVVSLELDDRVDDGRIEQVWSETRDALAEAAVRLPPGLPAPLLDTDRASAFTVIGAIVMADGLAPNPALQRRFAEALQDRLRQVPETKVVRLFGAREEEVEVTLDPDRAALTGLSFRDVATAVARADAKVRAGEMANDALDVLVEVEGEITDLARLRRIPLATDDVGGVVRLGDMATVRKGVASPAAELAFVDGRAAVLVAARIEDDRRIDVWTAAVRATIAEFETVLPDGLEHRLVFDQSDYVAERFAGLGVNIAIGVGLVVAVLFVSLGARAALVVAATIPLAALGSIVVMQALGLPIQQMSVTGLIVALGLLVDAAIVITDDVRRRLTSGRTALEAASEAVRRLAAPLAASTVTTILAFLPMALLPGPAGDFVGSIALAVIIMLSVSLALALTIVPALAGRLLRPRPVREVRTHAGARLFEGSLRLALANRPLAILFALVPPIAGFLSLPTLTAQFFPGVDRDQLYIQIEAPAGTGIERTAALAHDIDAAARALGDIQRIDWVVGRSAPAFYYNMKMERDGDPRFAEGLVRTASPEATERLIPALQAGLDHRFPEARVLVRGLVQGPPVDAPLELRVVGPDLAVLRTLGDEVRRRMAALPEVVHARADLSGGAPKLVFRADEEEARLAGLTLGEVAAQMEARLAGATGGSLVEASEELAVRVRLDADLRDDPDRVRGLLVTPPDAAAHAAGDGIAAIPLSTLGTLAFEPSESPINRRDGERVNTVQGFLVRGVLPEEALAKVERRLAEDPLALPPGYHLERGGDADARAETTADLAASAGLVVTLTVVTIVLVFGGFRLSIVAFAVAGLSFGLSLLALAVFQYPFGIQALIGAIGSIGVSINAAIIVLTALQADPAAMRGETDAIVGVVSRQARHILSTTVTTVGGFLPLILSGGGFWPPFAMAIAGGVALSVVLAFYFTPPMFSLLVGRVPAMPDDARRDDASRGETALAVG